jgi:membrane protease YdiL (CAAX protease family)
VSGAVRCPACGVLNELPGRTCIACDTYLPAVKTDTAVASQVLVTDEAGWLPVRGVVIVFLTFVALGVGNFVAARAEVPEAPLDLAATLVLAAAVAIVTATAWRELWPALRTFGGVRGLVAAVVGFGVLAGFATAYFEIFATLGVPSLPLAKPYLTAGWPLWSAYLLISVAPGLLEELALRGYVMTRLDRLLTPNETLVVQAALFAVLHFAPLIFPSHFVMGVILGVARRKSGSLYPGMLVHAGWNALVLARELADGAT